MSESERWPCRVSFLSTTQPVIALPDRSDRDVARSQRQVDRGQRPRDAQLRCRDGIQPHVDDRTGVFVVGVYPLQLGHPAHPRHQAVGRGAQRVDVAAVEPELQRGDVLVVELLEFDIGLGETVGPCVGILVEDIFGVVDRGGVDDELRVVLTCDLRGVTHLEARRGAPDERGDRFHARIVVQHPVDRVGYGGGAFQRRVGAQVDLHGELVAVGEGNHAQLELRGDQQRYDDRGDAHRDRQPAVAERPRQYAAVEVVYAVCDRLARFFGCTAGMMRISRNGMTSTASSSETIRLIVIVHGK